MKTAATTVWMIAIVLGVAGSVSASPLYVDDDAPPGGDGATWERAFDDLQDALAAAAASGGTVDKIRVAGGRYTPAPADGPRDATFRLVDGVIVDGGYAGYGATDPDERNIRLYETVLDGDLQGDDTVDSGTHNNVYHVVTIIGTSAGTGLDGLVITGGQADGPEPYDRGGGIYNNGGTLTLRHCRVEDNRARAGGGLYNVNAAGPIIANCLFARNVSDPWAGGAINSNNCTPTLVNCTIADNHAVSTAHGGGLMNPGRTEITLTNCVFWGNTAGGNAHESAQIGNGTITIDYCCVQGWTGTHGGIGNIGDDPLFAFPDDFHLLAASPCIDAGTDTPAGGLPLQDLDANSRPLDGDGDAESVADMGAYEYNADAPSIALSPATFEFNARLDGGNPLYQALSLRDCGGATLHWEITGGTSWLTVSPVGGESGGEVDEVTLSADSSGLSPGVHGALLEVTDPQAVNSPRIVTVSLYLTTTRHVPSEYTTIQAAIDAAGPGDIVEIADGTYTGAGNKNLDIGGKAITVRSGSGRPARCVIDCEGDGRGFVFRRGESPDSIIMGLTITNGSVDSGGGVLCENHSSPTITDCVIIRNEATRGGGVHCEANCVPGLFNCLIGDNAASADGGGINCREFNDLTITSCTISGNQAGRYGGGVHCPASGPMITSSILWSNAPQAIEGESGTPVITYSAVQGGWEGEGNIDDDPQFAFAHDYHLLPGSPCIDAATDDPPGGLPATDLDGNPRSLDGDDNMVATADMGVYEFNPAAPSIALSASVFEFTGDDGGENPPDQVLSVRNCGGGTLSWAITGQPTWLTVSPPTGESDGGVTDVTLSVDSTGLPPGVHSALLVVSDPHAVNSPREVPVSLFLTSVLRVPGEFPTIQAGIDASVDGEVVEIADGTYSGAGNKNLDLGGKAITVRSASGDPAGCVIDCEGDGRGFYFHSGEDPDTIVEGLTVTNGFADSADPGGEAGGGVYCEAGDTLLSNCWIIRNDATWDGGAIYGGGWVDNPTVRSCTITGNSADRGGALFCTNQDSDPVVTNSILWDNAPTEISVEWGYPVVTYCDVQGGWAGAGDIDADPLFVDPDGPDGDPDAWTDNNYRLRGNSPCVNAGDPAYVPADGETDLNGGPRVLCGRVDMGAYEYGFGDYNCDGEVDLGDYAAWDGCCRGPDAGPYDTGCEPFDADYDGDVDLLDFAEFQWVFGP